MADPMTDAEIEALRLMKFSTSLDVGCGVYATDEERHLHRLAVEHYNAKLQVIAELKRVRAENAKLREDSDWLGWLEAAGVDNWEGYGIAQDMRDEAEEADGA